MSVNGSPNIYIRWDARGYPTPDAPDGTDYNLVTPYLIGGIRMGRGNPVELYDEGVVTVGDIRFLLLNGDGRFTQGYGDFDVDSNGDALWGPLGPTTNPDKPLCHINTVGDALGHIKVGVPRVIEVYCGELIWKGYLTRLHNFKHPDGRILCECIGKGMFYYVDADQWQQNFVDKVPIPDVFRAVTKAGLRTGVTAQIAGTTLPDSRPKIITKTDDKYFVQSAPFPAVSSNTLEMLKAVTSTEAGWIYESMENVGGIKFDPRNVREYGRAAYRAFFTDDHSLSTQYPGNPNAIPVVPPEPEPNPVYVKEVRETENSDVGFSTYITTASAPEVAPSTAHNRVLPSGYSISDTNIKSLTIRNDYGRDTLGPNEVIDDNYLTKIIQPGDTKKTSFDITANRIGSLYNAMSIEAIEVQFWNVMPWDTGRTLNMKFPATWTNHQFTLEELPSFNVGRRLAVEQAEWTTSEVNGKYVRSLKMARLATEPYRFTFSPRYGKTTIRGHSFTQVVSETWRLGVSDYFSDVPVVADSRNLNNAFMFAMPSPVFPDWNNVGTHNLDFVYRVDREGIVSKDVLDCGLRVSFSLNRGQGQINFPGDVTLIPGDRVEVSVTRGQNTGTFDRSSPDANIYFTDFWTENDAENLGGGNRQRYLKLNPVAAWLNTEIGTTRPQLATPTSSIVKNYWAGLGIILDSITIYYLEAERETERYTLSGIVHEHPSAVDTFGVHQFPINPTFDAESDDAKDWATEMARRYSTIQRRFRVTVSLPEDMRHTPVRARIVTAQEVADGDNFGYRNSTFPKGGYAKVRETSTGSGVWEMPDGTGIPTSDDGIAYPIALSHGTPLCSVRRNGNNAWVFDEWVPNDYIQRDVIDQSIPRSQMARRRNSAYLMSLDINDRIRLKLKHSNSGVEFDGDCYISRIEYSWNDNYVMSVIYDLIDGTNYNA